MKDLKVVITGGAGSGKRITSLALKKLLEENGATVVLADSEEGLPADELLALLPEVAPELSVTIETLQTHRASLDGAFSVSPSMPYLSILLGVRRSLKKLAAREDVHIPEAIRAELTALQYHIKGAVNSQYPLLASNRFVLTDQETLLKQHEKIVKTARETMHRMIHQLDSMDFRPLASGADYAMQTILANVDNDKLSDADFREFIRTFSTSSTDDIANTVGECDSGEMVSDTPILAVQEKPLYCTACGGEARSLGYNQWVCDSCKAPLGPARVTETKPNQHRF